MIKHQINYHSSYRYIQPNRVCPASYFLVRLDTILQPSPQGNNHKWDDCRRENRVRCQDGEVHRSYPALTSESSCSVMIMVREIRDQEHQGDDECRDHKFSVPGGIPSFDEAVSDQKENGACGIQDGIDRWKAVDHGSTLLERISASRIRSFMASASSLS